MAHWKLIFAIAGMWMSSGLTLFAQTPVSCSLACPFQRGGVMTTVSYGGTGTTFTGDVYPTEPRPTFAFKMGYTAADGPIRIARDGETFYRYTSVQAAGCYANRGLQLGFTDNLQTPHIIIWDVYLTNFTERRVLSIEIFAISTAGATHRLDYINPSLPIFVPESLPFPGETMLDPAKYVPGNIRYTIQWPQGLGSSMSGLPNFENTVFGTSECPGNLTPVMTSTTPAATNLAYIPVTVQFGEAVTDFTASDIVPGNAMVVNFQPTGAPGNYTFELRAFGAGRVTADIPAGAAKDVNGKLSVAAVQFSRVFDDLRPLVTINQAAGQADPAAAAPVNFTVQFNEPVSGFANSCIALSGTAAPTTASVSSIAPNNGTAYNVQVSGMSGSGTVVASVQAGCAADAAGNTNSPSSSSDNTVTFSSAGSGLSVTSVSVLYGVSGNFNMAGNTRNRLPWSITGIRVQFSRPILSADLTALTGVTPTQLSGVGTGTLTWRIQPLSAKSVIATIAATGAGAPKDASGAGLAGSFKQPIKALWADVNDDGTVNPADVQLVNNARASQYSAIYDLNGDGRVDLTDVVIAGSRLKTKLP